MIDLNKHMAELIPAIIAKNFIEVRDMADKVEKYVRWVQLDIMDDLFVPNLTWNNPEDLKGYNPAVFLEAHLMVKEPEKYVEKWIDAGIKRVIFHFEATDNHHDIIKLSRQKNVKVGVAINPETTVESIKFLEELVDMVLVLSVTPGFGGQKFRPEVIQKIKALRASNPYLTIGVDGGMNPTAAKAVVKAGADIVVTGSYIFGSDDVEKAINEMKEAIS